MRNFFVINFIGSILYFFISNSALAYKCPEPIYLMIRCMQSGEDDARGTVLNVHVIDADEERLYLISRDGRVSVESGSIHGPPSVLRYNIFTAPPGNTDCNSLRVSSDSVEGMVYMQDAVVVMLHGICEGSSMEMTKEWFDGLRIRRPDRGQRFYEKIRDSIGEKCPAMTPVLQEIGAYKNWMFVEKQDRAPSCSLACDELMRLAPKWSEILKSMCLIMCR